MDRSLAEPSAAELDPPEAASEGTEEAEPVRAPTDDERRAYAASVFEAQPFDPVWARQAKRDLGANLDGINAGKSRIASVECKSSLCRVELQHDNEQDEQDFLRQVIRKHAWQGQGMAVRGDPGAGGEAQVTVYFAAEGVPLPEAPM